ncbi:MAG: SPOR domain-containing protein [Deltaproteobacteria bacterium]|jgi:hypothetical protein|nr:SPOR domain-containing protein [Deltaproteobacteria bacterium]
MRFLRRFRARKSTASSDVPLVELDRWQLTGLLFGVLVITVGAFIAGLSIGKRESHARTETAPAPLARTLGTAATAGERHIALAEVWPPTGGIDETLSRPITPPLPTDPTERARAQAHMQLQEARSVGLRNDVVVGAAPTASAPTIMPEAGKPAGGYTLQVSLFDTQASAQVMAGELANAGHAVRLRQVRSTDGRDLFRVEVGEFQSTDAATAYQRRFERDSGYSCVLVSR